MSRLPEVVSAVTVTEPVDGTPPKSTRSRGSASNRRLVFDETLSLDDCHPKVARAARRSRKPGQVYRIVSPVEVWIVNS